MRYWFVAVLVVLFSALPSSMPANARDETPLPENVIWALDWSPDGRLVATGHFDGTIRIMDALTRSLVHSFQVDPPVRIQDVAWSPDGNYLAAAYGSIIDIWDTREWKNFRTLAGSPVGYEVTALAWSPDGTRVAGIIADENYLDIWDVRRSQLLWSETTPPLADLSWSSNGIISGAAIGAGILLFDANGVFIRNFVTNAHVMAAVAASPDGTRFASGSMSGTVDIWDAKSGQLLHVLAGSANQVTSVAWHPSEALIAAANLDGSIVIWNADNGQLVHTIEIGTPVLNARWSPDGKALAYTGDPAVLGADVVFVPSSALLPEAESHPAKSTEDP